MGKRGKKSSGFAASAGSAPKANPFNAFSAGRQGRQKIKIMNKRNRGVSKNPKARIEANLLRKKTLLLELQNQSKQNTFVDKRFGENEEGMEQHEKDFLRFQKERQSRSAKKASRFNLQDTEELTHYGTSLSEIKHVNGVKADSDDEDGDAPLNSAMIDALTRGSGPGQRTKKEILEEIIAKSKMYKAERQEKAEEQAQMLSRWRPTLCFRDFFRLLLASFR
jgi:nucleolar protein 14